MEDQPRGSRRWRARAIHGGNDGAGSAPSLIDVLWRRRLTLVIAGIACLAAALVYLRVAKRTYRAAATLQVVQNGPKVFSDAQGSAGSEGFLATQVRVLQSAAVLSRALRATDFRDSATFASLPADPVSWLQGGGALAVEVVPKADVISVSMESPDPYEAARFANAVAKSYIEENTERRRATGQETVAVLRQERESLQRRGEAAAREVARLQRERGVLSFRTNDNGNVVLQRTASLAASLTAAELATVDLRAQQQALGVALRDPASMAAFVDSVQYRQRDGGDREYDELRTQLVQQLLQLSAAGATMGENHPDVRALDARAALLRRRVAAKQRAIIDAQVVTTSVQLSAAQDRERQLRGLLDAQQGRAGEMTPDALRVAALEGEFAQAQKQCEVLDARIAEVSANSVERGPLNVQVIDWAPPPQAAAQPRTGLTLIAAFALSCVIGVGLALTREWFDNRLRAPSELPSLLNVPLVAEIPNINRRLPAAVRGRVVWLDGRSRAADAYRAIRTALELEAAADDDARTILVSSAAAGDGKSTTASNLAIALANAGHRTLLVDCDLIRPVQHLIFSADQGVGLTTAAAGDGKIGEAIWPTAVPGLWLLPSGPIPASPSDVLTSKRFALLMAALRGAFDRVVIDSPPLATTSDAHLLAASADATLLVVRMKQSRRDAAAAAAEALRRAGANLVGVVANDVAVARSVRHYSYAGLGAASPLADQPPVVVHRRRRRLQNCQRQEALPVIVEPDWADVR